MDTEVYIGTIQLFGFFFAPSGWLSCEGQTLNITQYQALFALIGNTYGGDGRTTFAVPNLNGAAPLPNMKYYIALTGLYPTRD
ncbi:MAG TPA: tail fiber protein [Bacteroidales bacterium]|nr:tail fiber protein [Bacteroidales bacterium]HPS16682.1 tail fiber protein [Bacteroidales bacterium]